VYIYVGVGGLQNAGCIIALRLAHYNKIVCTSHHRHFKCHSAVVLWLLHFLSNKHLVREGRQRTQVGLGGSSTIIALTLKHTNVALHPAVLLYYRNTETCGGVRLYAWIKEILIVFEKPNTELCVKLT
jgi:hypothetical protein